VRTGKLNKLFSTSKWGLFKKGKRHSEKGKSQ